MKLLIINFCAFCLLLSCSQLFAQNNLAIIDSLVTEMTTEIINSSETEIKKNVILKIGEFEYNLSGYLRTKIGNILSENNYNVFRNFPKDTSFESTIFEVQNCNVLIKYSEPFYKQMLGETLIPRLILFKIEGQVYNYIDSRVIMPVKIEKQFTDEIIYSEIVMIEQSPFEFTYGTQAGVTFWQEILEPAIVVSSVLVVLLLLFTQRS
ncbi:MAG: hypothetical protein KAS18_03135 [Calditrichia bacterium]|nr:hypothetical protein [Calditrichia bacterium]